MAQSDVNLIFSSAQALTASAASTNFLDLATGTAIPNTSSFTAYTALPLVWGANSTNLYFGEDLGIGPQKMPVGIYSGATNFATATSLNIQFQGAVDSGGTSYGGLTWNTYDESGTIITSLLTANSLLYGPWFPLRKIAAAATNGSMPRFLQLNYVVAGSNFSNATIQFAGFLQTRDDSPVGFYGSGFVVGA